MLTLVRRLMSHLFRGHAGPYADIFPSSDVIVDAPRPKGIPDGYMDKLPPIAERDRDREPIGGHAPAPPVVPELGDWR